MTINQLICVRQQLLRPMKEYRDVSSQARETAEAARLFKNDLDGHGFVMNLSRLWAWRPDVCEGFIALRSNLMNGSSLSQRERAVIVCATVSRISDSYCSLAWGKQLAAASDAAIAAAVLQGSSVVGMPPRERALASWARLVTDDPNATTPDDVPALPDAGLSDREIFEATVLVAFRLAFSTVNDALGVLPIGSLPNRLRRWSAMQ